MTDEQIDQLMKILRYRFEDWVIAYSNGRARMCDIFLCMENDD